MAGKPKSTAVATPKAQLPANFSEQQQADIAKLGAQLAAPSSNAITPLLSKRFRYMVDGEKVEVDTFRGVILDFVSMNAYYEGEYDKDNIVPPNCFAIGAVKNDDLEASPNSPDPQNADEDNACRSCWANQWKSAPKGNGKACKNSVRLAVLCADGEVRTLSLSSTAIKPFGEYIRTVVQTFGVAPYGVMTEFSFDPKSEYASVRCGKPIKLDEDQVALAYSRKDDGHAMISQEPDCSEFQEKVVDMREKPKGKAAAKPPVSKGKAVSRAGA